MLATVEQQAAVNFVRQDHDVAVADYFGNLLDLAPPEHSTRRILWRIEDDQLGALTDEPGQFVHIEREITVFTQLNRHRVATNVVNHGLVDGKAGIGIDDLIALVDQREDCEEDDGLAPGDDHHFIARYFHASGPAHVFGERLPQIRQTGGRTVMGPALSQGVHSGLYDVRRRVEIRFTDLQMDDAFPLFFKSARFIEHLKCRLGAESGHALG